MSRPLITHDGRAARVDACLGLMVHGLGSMLLVNTLDSEYMEFEDPLLQVLRDDGYRRASFYYELIMSEDGDDSYFISYGFISVVGEYLLLRFRACQ